jgi:hypothetical protein
MEPLARELLSTAGGNFKLKNLTAALIIAVRLSGVQCNIVAGINNWVTVGGMWGAGNAHCFVGIWLMASHSC